MQRLEHDMDELFQKAAENYPLKTGEGNWETIAGRLTEKQVVINKPAKASSRKKYLSAAMLLLAFLLLSDIVLRYNDKRSAASFTNKIETESQPENKPGYSDSRIGEDKLIMNNRTAVAKKRIYQKDQSTKHLTETVDEMRLMNEHYYKQVFKTDNAILEPVNIGRADLVSIKTRSIPLTSIKNANNLFNPGEKKGFYWGILAGPQFSEVKGQGSGRSGFDAGILAGYRINKNLSIESGLFFSSKYYYSDAKYFKMSPDPSMPANMVLMNLKGKSNVVEIPLKLRVDIFNTRDNKFFATAGFSSYLLTNENNNYHAMVNGTEEYMKKSYKKNSAYSAAGINITGGLEHRIIKQNFIRIEPYFQIPLKGIGVGSMPVTSAGIHIGITTNNRKR
jgi:hypothetical protein